MEQFDRTFEQRVRLADMVVRTGIIEEIAQLAPAEHRVKLIPIGKYIGAEEIYIYAGVSKISLERIVPLNISHIDIAAVTEPEVAMRVTMRRSNATWFYNLREDPGSGLHE